MLDGIRIGFMQRSHTEIDTPYDHVAYEDAGIHPRPQHIAPVVDERAHVFTETAKEQEVYI